MLSWHHHLFSSTSELGPRLIKTDKGVSRAPTLLVLKISSYWGNVCLIFTKGDLKEVNEEVAKYKVGAPARVGLVAPVDVVVPPANTGLDPSQTSFFQVLNIPTKINKGTVEIITPVELIKKGDKVGSSEALEKILELRSEFQKYLSLRQTYKETSTCIHTTRLPIFPEAAIQDLEAKFGQLSDQHSTRPTKFGDDRIIFLIDKAMQHSHSNDDTCFRMDVIDEVTEEELDALLNDSEPFLSTSEKINETSLD
ncbi:60S acidic ribosomal protein P0 [Tanacetum coccineum]